MTGKVIKQINNLKITKDDVARLYRVYNPDGVEIYNSPSATDVKARCTVCKDYVKNASYRYFDVHVNFDADGEDVEGYSVFIKTKDKMTCKADIIAYAVKHSLFSEDGDEYYVDNVSEISYAEYQKAIKA